MCRPLYFYLCIYLFSSLIIIIIIIIIIITFFVLPNNITGGKSLRKHAYSNILKFLQPKKKENFQIKTLIFFIFLLKT